MSRSATCLTLLSSILLLTAQSGAAPAFVSGSYALSISGSDGANLNYADSTGGAIVGSFSDSISDAVPNPAFSSSAGVTLRFTPGLIQITGMAVSTSVGPGLPTPGFPLARADVALEFSFSLAQPHLVSGGALFDSSSNAAMQGFSSIVSFDGLTDNPLNCDPNRRLCLDGILPAGTYTFKTQASTTQTNQAGFDVKLSLAPIPEVSAAIVFPLGLAVVMGVAALRRRA